MNERWHGNLIQVTEARQLRLNDIYTAKLS